MAIIENWVEKATDRICDEATPQYGSNLIQSSKVAEIITEECPFKEGMAYIELKPIPRGIVVDWATKAAQYLVASEQMPILTGRVAAVIATFAQPLVDTLRAARIGHRFANDGSGCLKAEVGGEDEECNCGADEHNARIDKALGGLS